MGVFDYVKSINKKDDYLEITSEYVPFIINKAFSTYSDTVFYANAMNMASYLDKQLQYDFYFYGVNRNPKRFAPYPKKNNDKYLLIIKEYYKCSLSKAIEIINVLNDTQLQILEMKLNKGGKENGRDIRLE